MVANNSVSIQNCCSRTRETPGMKIIRDSHSPSSQSDRFPVHNLDRERSPREVRACGRKLGCSIMFPRAHSLSNERSLLTRRVRARAWTASIRLPHTPPDSSNSDNDESLSMAASTSNSSQPLQRLKRVPRFGRLGARLGQGALRVTAPACARLNYIHALYLPCPSLSGIWTSSRLVGLSRKSSSGRLGR